MGFEFGSDEWIAEQIGYPEEWDTAAYPTLASALWELYSSDRYVEKMEK
ncbi:MAG: hypothetical protein ACXQTL_03950 [Methanosarcinales archaeon]